MKMQDWRLISLIGLVAFYPAPRLWAQEDVVELTSGQVLKGTYAGGTASTVRFEMKEGMKVLTRDEILAITFAKTSPKAPAAAVEPAPKQPAPAAPAGASVPVTLPAGTLLLVKMETQVTSSDQSGRRFQARLANRLEANGKVAAPEGTIVFGRVEQAKQAGRLRGKSTLQLTLTELSLGGKAIPISTGNYAEAGANSFKKTARNAGMGAAVGAAFDGGEGAAKGAAIGAAVSVVKKGESVTIPVNAVLEFRLTGPLSLTVTG